MFILKVFKHGFLHYRNRDIRTPCIIKIKQFTDESLEKLEIDLRMGGFKEGDYELLLDSEPFLEDMSKTYGFELLPEGDYKEEEIEEKEPEVPLRKEKPKPVKEKKGPDLLKEIRNLEKKVDSLFSLRSQIEDLGLKISNIQITPIVQETISKKRQKEDADVDVFIPSLDSSKMKISTKAIETEKTNRTTDLDSIASALSKTEKRSKNGQI